MDDEHGVYKLFGDGTLEKPYYTSYMDISHREEVCIVCGEPAGWYYSMYLGGEKWDYWQGPMGQWCKVHIQIEVEQRIKDYMAWREKQPWYLQKKMI